MSAKPPTMTDVASLAGVSPMTVSRALRPDTSVSIKTREKIQAAADELNYVINANAANFSSRKTGFIAVTIPSINNANFADTISGITDGLKGSGLQILLGYTNYSKKEEEQLVEQFLQRRPEAIVVTGGSHNPRCDKLLRNAGIPVFEIWDTPDTPIDEVIGFSNADACALMVDHFVDLGLEKMGFIGGDTSRDTRGLSRREGFIARLKELELDHHRIVSAGNQPISMREGARSMRTMLRQWPDTQAVMCVSDLSAFGALTECVRMGMTIPQDIAIAGFGDYDLSEISIPSLTTIDVSARKIGLITADKLIKRLNINNNIQLSQENVIVPKLITRESTNA